MAGLPGGGRGPSGVPKFVSAPATQPVGDSTTYIARAPTFVPTWRAWTPPGGTYGFVDYSIGGVPPARDTTHILRAPTFTPTWQRYRIENLGFVQSVPLTLKPAAAAVPVFMPGVTVWSNPRAPQRSVDLLTWTQSLSALGLSPPFAQNDWPNPVRPRPVIVTDWIADTNVGLLRPGVNPQINYDWPNPQLARRAQDYIVSTNLGLLRPDVNPFAKRDWPNPTGPPSRPDWIADTNLGLLRPDINPFIPHDWANPRLALAPVSDWLAQGIRAAVVVQAPFAQFAWPNPLISASRQDFIADTNIGLLRPNVNPEINYDWPNPRGPINLSLYKFTDYISGLGVVVTQPDTTHILRAPVYTPRWQPYRIVNFDWSQSVTALNLPPAVVTPPDTTHIIRTPTFTPTWQPWQARSYVNWADYYSILVVTPPDTTHILRAPLYTPRWQPRWPISLFTFVNGVRGTVGVTPPVAPPFIPVSWPNPPPSPDRGLYQKWSDYYSIQIIPPPTNYDQPNPRLPQSNRADWIQATSLTLRSVGVVQPPLRPLDWSNPGGAVGIHTGFAAGTNQGLLRPELNPFAQRDWQNPRGAVGSHVGFAAATQLNLLRPDVNPFLPRDFANPRAPLRSIDLYGWIQALSALVIPPPPPPTFPPNGQYNWPNPAGPQRGIDLFGWSQSPTALTLPETIIPPPTVLQPGGASVPHTFSRKRWKELQALIAAEMAAVAKAERLTKPAKQEALLKVARAAAAAVDAAEAEGENPKLDRELLRNAAAIRAAIRSSQNETRLLEKALAAIEQSHAIVGRVDEDEENEMISLLLLFS